MLRTEAEWVQAVRSAGWAYVLDLIARGLEEDASVCEGEGWPRTAVALAQASEDTGRLADRVRRSLGAAEANDRANGCD